MKSAPLPSNEGARLTTLRGYELLDSEREPAFEAVTTAAAQLCNAPIAIISLVDDERQWFKSVQGLNACSTGRDVSFCAHAMLGSELFEVPNALDDDRFATNPLVTGDPHIRAYFGVPLVEPGGLPLGALCIIDREPRTLTALQRRQLGYLARCTVRLITLRIRPSELADPGVAFVASVDAGEGLEARVRTLLALCDRLAA